MSSIASLFVPTKFTNFSTIMSHQTGTDESGPTFTNVDAAAEFKAWYQFEQKNNPTGGVNGMNMASIDADFAGFLQTERNWWSGHYRIPFTPIVFNKWIGYGGAAAFLFLMMKKKGVI